MIRTEGLAILAAAVLRLGESEAMVLQLYFVEELSLDEIGVVLGVGSARVCAIKRAAIDWLGEAISEPL